MASWFDPLPDAAYDTANAWDTRPCITPEALTAWRLRMRQHRLLSTGALSSRHHGSGMTAGEARAYVPGDDPRLMDWALLARTTHAYVRPPQHEPDEGVAVIIDASTPMAFGDDTSKLLWAAEWTCWLSAWLVAHQYRTDVFLWQPGVSSSPWQHWRRSQQTSRVQPLPALIQWLYQQLELSERQAWIPHEARHDDWLPITSLQPALKPYRHVAVLSDFSPHMNADCTIQPWLDTLGPLCRRHRWHMVQVQHPLETSLSVHAAGLPLKSMMAGGKAPSSSRLCLSSELITAFAAQQQQRQQMLHQAFQSAGFAMSKVSTEDNPQESLEPLLEWVR